jgi:hypothetical protein
MRYVQNVDEHGVSNGEEWIGTTLLLRVAARRRCEHRRGADWDNLAVACCCTEGTTSDSVDQRRLHLLLGGGDEMQMSSLVCEMAMCRCTTSESIDRRRLRLL